MWKYKNTVAFGGDSGLGIGNPHININRRPQLLLDQATSIITIIPDGVNFIKDLLEPKLISLRLVKKVFGRIVFRSIEIYPPDASQ